MLSAPKSWANKDNLENENHFILKITITIFFPYITKSEPILAGTEKQAVRFEELTTAGEI